MPTIIGYWFQQVQGNFSEKTFFSFSWSGKLFSHFHGVVDQPANILEICYQCKQGLSESKSLCSSFCQYYPSQWLLSSTLNLSLHFLHSTLPKIFFWSFSHVWGLISPSPLGRAPKYFKTFLYFQQGRPSFLFNVKQERSRLNSYNFPQINTWLQTLYTL